MASFNQVILVGNLTRDPALRNVGETSVTDFGLAVNRKFKTKAGEDKEEVLFIDCTAWGKSGEIIQKYCTKGKPLLISGSLRLETWTDKKDGSKRSKHTVNVDSFQFLGDGGKKEGNAPSEAPKSGGSFGDGPPVTDQDIPFAWEGRDQQPI